MIKIKISNLKDGAHEYDFHGKVEELLLTEPFFGEYDLKISLDKSHRQIVIDSDGTMKAHFECDRCATTFDRDIPIKFRIVYLTEAPVKDSDDTNIIYITPETEKIDLTSEVYDFAQLSVPMKHLCSEDCKGLCYLCGVNLNETTCQCDHKKGEESNSPFSILKDLINKTN